jgi:hypothetical protein
MTTEYEVRLEDIRRGPWREQSQLARRRLQGFSETEARRYFRSHYEDGIYDRWEIAFRESFDQALEEIQLLELAVCCGYLPLEVIRFSVERDFEELFASWPARRYIAVYDYVPVRFLAARLGFDLGLPPVEPPPVNPRAGLRYATFLAVHSEFASNKAIERFTMLLDDYVFHGVISARTFKEKLGSGSADSHALEDEDFQVLCLGFVEFIQTLGDFFLQLDPEETPIFGCLYAYWLSHFFGFSRTEKGYESDRVSFEDTSLNRALFPADLAFEQLNSERNRVRLRVPVLRRTWDSTRDLVQSLDSTVQL